MHTAFGRRKSTNVSVASALFTCLAGDAVGEQMRIVRANSLQEFKLDPSIDVLLMDGVATVGHDLSFVSDIICMEAIQQRDAWDQLISRAYRMGADVRRPINVTTLAYKGSAEERLVPEYASRTVTSIGAASLPVSSCNVDCDQVNGHAVSANGQEDWEEDWGQDSAARQAAAVAVDCPVRSKQPAPKRRKRTNSNTPRTPRTPRQHVGSASAAASAATAPPSATLQRLAVAARDTLAPSPGGPTCICVLKSQTFLGARTGHEFKLGPQGLGYYPTPERLRMLHDGLRGRPQGRRRERS